MVNNNLTLNQASTLSLLDQCASRTVGTFCSGLSVVILAPVAQKLLVGALATQVANPAFCSVVATTALGALAPSGLNAAHKAGQALWSWTKWTAGQACSYSGLFNRAAQNAHDIAQDLVEVGTKDVDDDLVYINDGNGLLDKLEELREQAIEVADNIEESVAEVNNNLTLLFDGEIDRD